MVGEGMKKRQSTSVEEESSLWDTVLEDRDVQWTEADKKGLDAKLASERNTIVRLHWAQ